MFLRIKKVKGKEYCYLVENKWKDGKALQTVKKYFGRVVRADSGTVDFFDFYSIKNVDLFLKKKDKKEILRDVVVWELSAAGFSRCENGLEKNGIGWDDKMMELCYGNKHVVLRLNDGFLCDYTLHKILAFRRSGNIEKGSVALARAFVDAGLRVPKEVFIGFFGKG